MALDLACLLSYGLLCTPARVEVVEVPPPAPLVTAVTTPPAPIDAKPGAASLVLARVQGFYDGTTDLQSRFTQTYMNPVYGSKKVSQGQLRARKPGMMVWDYAGATDADYWVDGTELAVVESATKQVIRQSLSQSSVTGANQFLFGGRALTEDFEVKLASDTLNERYGQPAHTSIRLRPKQSSADYKELILVVDDATGRVDAFVVLNQDKSTNHFVLTDFVRNPGLPDERFKFVKPAGYKQISATP